MKTLPAPIRKGLQVGGDCLIPGQRIDPITGECKFFLGTQPGPDPIAGGGGTGMAVQGAFGMPAMQPMSEMRRRLSCPSGMVLGKDDLCYPRAVLRRDSRFRKWRPGMRPVLTGGERHGIARARRSITRAKEATAGLGITVKKR